MSNKLKGYLGKAMARGRQVLGPTLQPIQVITSTGAASVWQGPPGGGDIVEIVIVANAANVSDVQIAIDAAVGAANYLPLPAGAGILLEGITLDQLHLKFIGASPDKVHLVITKVTE